MKVFKLFSIPIFAFVILVISSCSNTAESNKTESESKMASDSSVNGNKMTMDPNSEKKAGLRTDMRKLWEDHVTWTRNVIFCIIDDLPGTNQAVTRLLKNQDDIGNAIKPYYGDEAGKKLTDLLHVHITVAADLLKAAKSDNTAAFDEANKKWFTNADEISVFLSSANPNWKLEQMKLMMHDHLKLTTEEAVARKKKDYEADVKAYEKVHDEILMMSDMLSEGIIKQFPEKFK